MSLKKVIQTALAEDRAYQDVTSDLTIAKTHLSSFEIKPREEIIFCGKDIITEVFLQLKNYQKFRNSKINLEILTQDGDCVNPGKSIARLNGESKLILAAERTILNLIQHLSGIATITNQFVKKLNNPKIKILDTRKTLPGLRDLQKQAVVAGGGKNHRFNLSDLILIKDNHIAANSSAKFPLAKSLKSAKKLGKKIEIECDNFKQVEEAVESNPDIIMLDNMAVAEIKKCAELIRKKSPKIKIEVSGGINLDNIKNYSDLDIDFISIGALTHSVRAVDIGLDIVK